PTPRCDVGALAVGAEDHRVGVGQRPPRRARRALAVGDAARSTARLRQPAVAGAIEDAHPVDAGAAVRREVGVAAIRADRYGQRRADTVAVGAGAGAGLGDAAGRAPLLREPPVGGAIEHRDAAPFVTRRDVRALAVGA